MWKGHISLERRMFFSKTLLVLAAVAAGARADHTCMTLPFCFFSISILTLMMPDVYQSFSRTIVDQPSNQRSPMLTADILPVVIPQVQVEWYVLPTLCLFSLEV